MFPHQICPEILGSNVTHAQQIHARHWSLIPYLSASDDQYADDDKTAIKKK